MAIVSDVEIRLRADIARLQQDMDRARQSVSSTMSRITSLAKGAMGALAAIGGVAVFAGFVKSAVDALDAISDVSQRTGIAVEELAGLQLWFQKGGMEADALEGAMVKLSRSIADGGKEFKKLGVSTREADGSLRSNVAVLLDSADAFAKMQDGTAKTALAVDLFGKSGAALLPMLNEGSKGLREMNELAETLGLTFDQKTVDAAGQFNDTLDFLGLAAQGVGRQVAAELLPTMNSAIESMYKYASSGDGVRKAASVIATGFKIVFTAGAGIVTLFNTIAEVIAGTFSFIGNTLGTVFMGLKQAIEGNYAQAWNTLTQGGQRSAAILSTTFRNVKDEVSAGATAISDVWTETGGESVAAMVSLTKARKYLTDEERKAAEEARKAAEKNAEAYAGMLAQVNARVAATAREVDGLGVMSEAEKFAIDLADQLARGKIKLTDAQQKYVLSLNAEAGANVVLAASNKEYEELLAKLAKNAEDLTAERTALIDSAREEAEQNERLVETFGMSEAAIIRLHAARLLEQEAQRLGRELTADEIEDLQRVIELKERSAAAVAKREELEQVRDFWKSIDETAHDTFRSITDGGKDLGKRLKDTLKNTFFDWLYQQTIKKWIINIGTSVSGGGISGIASAMGNSGGSSGSGAGGFTSAISSLYDLYKGGSGAGTGKGLMGSFDWIGAGKQLYQGYSSAVSAGGFTGGAAAAGGALAGVAGGIYGGRAISNGFGSNSAVNSGVGVGAAIGTYILPVIGTALGALVGGLLGGVYNRAFGYKDKKFSDTSTVNGAFGSGGFNGTLDTAWTQEGGWFRSDKKGMDKGALDAAMVEGLVKAYDSVKLASKDYAGALGITADALETRSQALSVSLGKDQAANEKALVDFFAGVSDQMAAELVPGIAAFQREGESTTVTFQRLAAEAAIVSAAFDAMGGDVQKAFGTVGLASLEARDRLVQMSGGIEAFTAQSQFFTNNFLTEAERLAPVQKELTTQLAALGHAGLSTSDDYKAAVLKLMSSGALATEEGAKQYAGLLALGPQFKMVADYLAGVAAAAAEAAEETVEELPNLELLKQARELQITIMEMEGRTLDALAERRRMELEEADDSLDPLLARIHALQDEARAADEAKEASERLAEANRANEGVLVGLVDKAMAALGRAVQAQKDRVTTAYQETMRGLEVAITSVNATIERTGELSRALRGAITAPAGGDTAARGQVARAEITAALAMARASGMLPSADSLAKALATVTQDSTDDFASFNEYQLAVARTNAELEALGGLSDKELTMAEKHLAALEKQKTTTEEAYKAEILRLDGILATAQAQVDATRGVDNSVQSVTAALGGLQVALDALKFGATAANPGGVNANTGSTVEELYRKVLGRDGDAAGIAFWKKAFGDAVDQTEYAAFIQGAQAELNGPPVVTPISSGTMSSKSANVEQEKINERMEASMNRTAAAVEQLAGQFNAVSGGGNYLLTGQA